jgi:signal peptidase I
MPIIDASDRGFEPDNHAFSENAAPRNASAQIALSELTGDNRIENAESDEEFSDDDANGAVASRGRTPKSPAGKLVEYAFLIAVAVVLASLIRTFVGLAFFIPSESMYPTLKIDDRVIVSRMSYRFGDIERAEVVVFRNPGFIDRSHPNIFEKAGRVLFEIVGSRQPKDKNYIKRVIGLPGDRMMFKDGAVYINGSRLKEPWLQPGVVTTFPGHENQEIVVPAGKYLMLGDNRSASCDSRCFGPDGSEKPVFIEKSAIVGRAFHRIWPPSRFGSL